jgi:hypothetical protein
LLLYDAGQRVLYALVDSEHLILRGRLIQTGQGPQDVLQIFALGVENVAQAQLLGGDGSNNFVQTPLAAQRRIVFGKCGH